MRDSGRRHHAGGATPARQLHGDPERADAGWPAGTAASQPGDNRRRLKALEWENRELRRVNRSLKNALKGIVRRVRFGAGDAADAPASRPVGGCAGLAESAQ